jgi:hypothetical protein
MRSGPTTDLCALIDTENAAILRGDFAAIDALSKRKATLVSALSRQPITADDIGMIKTKIVRNQVLLRAAIQGVTAARTRLAALRDVRDGLQVYDRSGQFANLPKPRPDLEKKA